MIKKIQIAWMVPILLLLPVLTLQAQGLAKGDKTGGPFGDFLNQLAQFIFGPLLVFLLAIAFITFAWGVLKYFIADAEGDKAAAKSLMIWGIGGFVLILILFGAVNLLVGFTGLGEGTIETDFTLPNLGGSGSSAPPPAPIDGATTG